MYKIREARPHDLDAIFGLSEILNSVNLPFSREALEKVLETSAASFSAQISDPFMREYLFVLENHQTGEVLGTSQVMAQHGTRQKPHIYLDVRDAEHYSTTMDTYFKHHVLRLGFDYDGPTEIGGLVLAPKARKTPDKLGKQLSFSRFLFMGLHREQFRDRVLAELLPPLLPGKKSLLWEALGARFTGLSYHEADEISKTNKEFIKSLFPTGAIYTTLFDEETREVIGQIGRETQGAAKMLTSLGFRHVNRIDPFDGGPHFEAETDSIWLIQRLKRAPCTKTTKAQIAEASGKSAEGLVAYSPTDQQNGSCSFCCTFSLFQWRPDGTLALPEDTIKTLGATTGSEVACIAFAEHLRR
jgi:arginine N-succinyltransferase